ncbi:MAG: hypothetical protein HW412_867 [Bacteroidetes bacterium]|nr:hypothetical protein [Bacteroidota bacterium]
MLKKCDEKEMNNHLKPTSQIYNVDTNETTLRMQNDVSCRCSSQKCNRFLDEKLIRVAIVHALWRILTRAWRMNRIDQVWPLQITVSNDPAATHHPQNAMQRRDHS